MALSLGCTASMRMSKKYKRKNELNKNPADFLLSYAAAVKHTDWVFDNLLDTMKDLLPDYRDTESIDQFTIKQHAAHQVQAELFSSLNSLKTKIQTTDIVPMYRDF